MPCGRKGGLNLVVYAGLLLWGGLFFIGNLSPRGGNFLIPNRILHVTFATGGDQEQCKEQGNRRPKDWSKNKSADSRFPIDRPGRVGPLEHQRGPPRPLGRGCFPEVRRSFLASPKSYGHRLYSRSLFFSPPVNTSSYHQDVRPPQAAESLPPGFVQELLSICSPGFAAKGTAPTVPPAARDAVPQRPGRCFAPIGPFPFSVHGSSLWARDRQRKRRKRGRESGRFPQVSGPGRHGENLPAVSPRRITLRRVIYARACSGSGSWHCTWLRPRRFDL